MSISFAFASASSTPAGRRPGDPPPHVRRRVVGACGSHEVEIHGVGRRTARVRWCGQYGAKNWS